MAAEIQHPNAKTHLGRLSIKQPIAFIPNAKDEGTMLFFHLPLLYVSFAQVYQAFSTPTIGNAGFYGVGG